MNVKTIKKAKPRIDVSYLSRFNLQSYGNDNLYPQNIKRIAQSSGTTELCLSRYSKFIEGYGFNNAAFAELVVNVQGDTADDIQHLVAQDLARYGGFALHVNYNVLCQITSVEHVPFENCRLEESDDVGNVAYIRVHPDWSRSMTRSGKRVAIDESTVDKIHVFNPVPSVVAAEIENVGGISNYKGQILWVSKDGKTTYPTPIYDSIVTECSTDEGLGNVKYRNVRNNFLVACMLVTKKGMPKTNDEGEEIEDGRMIADEDLMQFQGDENTGKILGVEIENDEDAPQVVQFPVKNYDKEFSVTDQSVVERIYSQFGQEIFYSIRIGKLGFSGQVIKDAYEYYAGSVTNEQRMIERAFGKIFSAWYNKAWANTDFVIQPLKYINSDNSNNNSIDNE